MKLGKYFERMYPGQDLKLDTELQNLMVMNGMITDGAFAIRQTVSFSHCVFPQISHLIAERARTDASVYHCCCVDLYHSQSNI